MDTIISKLYYGELCPSEKPAPRTKRCIENRAIICDTEEKLIEQFPKCKELLDTYSDALHVEAQLECEADFARGFRLGVLFMLDVMTTE
ncbi:MAG: hypothetical protein IK093_17025 [Ruminiclostridium sp.]|nr:hypothetical protein [Ruminiclostridium sp.]